MKFSGNIEFRCPECGGNTWWETNMDQMGHCFGFGVTSGDWCGFAWERAQDYQVFIYVAATADELQVIRDNLCRPPWDKRAVVPETLKEDT